MSKNELKMSRKKMMYEIIVVWSFRVGAHLGTFMGRGTLRKRVEGHMTHRLLNDF
jgi:hypothetical protein